ncbi:MAG: D-glycerate dehydrogenase [Pseudomonadota bacterium]
MVSKHPEKPRVVITRQLPDAIETRLMELFDTNLNTDDRRFDKNDLKKAVRQADALIPCLTDQIDADVIKAGGKSLKLIANFGTGVDHIDLAAAREHGIVVTHTPNVMTDDTADAAMGLIIDVARRLSEGDRRVRTNQWSGWSPTQMLGRRLMGKRLGIIGMGRIGRALANRARAFGMSIHYCNRNRVREEAEQRLEATYWSDLPAMLARVDVVSLNCPLTEATHHLINAHTIECMRRRAIIINVARGELIDDQDLLAALRSGRIAGAGLDVYGRATGVAEDLKTLENVVLLPHLGSATREGRIEAGYRVIMNVRAFFDGHLPPDRVLEADY